MNKYKCLNQNEFYFNEYKIVPIRFEDRLDIMKWRNEQIYHLRQAKPLSLEDQNTYFENVVSKLFEQANPQQLLFSFLKEDVCIGYGGLVHINWIDKNAEISFVMNTDLEENNFTYYWHVYLHLIEQVAFDILSFHKIFTYAFDLRPKLYDSLESFGYKNEARLKDHCFFENEFKDVLIHSKNINSRYFFRKAIENDVELFFNWVNDPDVRRNALNQENISWENHVNWFNNKINNSETQMYILYFGVIPLGQIRIDKIENVWQIDYSIDKNQRGKGIGKKLVRLLFESLNTDTKLVASVKKENIPSLKVFESLGFNKTMDTNNDLYHFEKLI